MRKTSGIFLSLVEKLKKQNFTRIAIEWTPDLDRTIDSLYQLYLKGEWELKSHEVYQIGFRLAKAMGHKKLYYVDNLPPMPESVLALDDIEEYAKKLNQDSVFHLYDERNNVYNSYMESLHQKTNVLEYLKLVNTKETALRNKQLWVTGLVHLGNGDGFVGADLTGHWYRRNTRIYTNVCALMKNKHENILVIYGMAHKWILDELLDANPEIELTQLNAIL